MLSTNCVKSLSYCSHLSTNFHQEGEQEGEGERGEGGGKRGRGWREREGERERERERREGEYQTYAPWLLHMCVRISLLLPTLHTHRYSLNQLPVCLAPSDAHNSMLTFTIKLRIAIDTQLCQERMVLFTVELNL